MGQAILTRADAGKLLDLAARYRKQKTGETYDRAIAGIRAARPGLYAAWRGEKPLTTDQAREILAEIK